MNFPDINVVFSFCVPGHEFEEKSRILLLSGEDFVFSDRGFDVLNLVINRFLEGLAGDLIEILLARKEEIKELLDMCEVANDDIRKGIMRLILLEVGIQDLEDIEILSDALWIKARRDYAEMIFWTYDEEHILPQRGLLELIFGIMVKRP